MSAISDTTIGPEPKRWTVEQYQQLGEIGAFKHECVELLNGLIYATHDGVRKRWTHEDYHAAGEAGLFNGERVELIDGEIYVTSPMSRRHASGILRVQEALYAVRKPGYLIRTQLPILADGSEPEPDVGLFQGTLDNLDDAVPGSLDLAVEVSLSSLEFDRTAKRRIYALQQISEYWILNLVDDCLEVYQQPVGDDYGQRTEFRTGQSVTCLAIPDTSIAIADLLPTRR